MPLPSFDEIEWEPKLLAFLQRAEPNNKHVVYINLGDGDDLVRADVDAVLAALGSRSGLVTVLSLPKRNRAQTAPDDLPPQILHVHHVPQFEFLAHFNKQLVLVITHASLANVQESLAAGLPVLLMPHAFVEQFEVAARFVRTDAVYVLQRVQLTEANVVKCLDKMIGDPGSVICPGANSCVRSTGKRILTYSLVFLIVAPPMRALPVACLLYFSAVEWVAVWLRLGECWSWCTAWVGVI